MRRRGPLPRALEARGYAVAPLVLLVVLLILAGARGTDLYTSTGIAGAVSSAAPLILATLAITPVALVGRGGADLSIGPLVAFVNVTVVHWVIEGGLTSPIAVFAFAMAVGLGFGVIQGALIGLLRVQPVIVTLSGYLVLAGLNLVILPQPGGTVPEWMASWNASTSVVSPISILVLAALALWWALGRTDVLRTIRLVGSDERTAYASGIDLLRARLVAHAIGGVFAGLAGVAYTALIQSADPTQGSSYTLMTITALVLGGVSLAGGLGGATGAVLGAVDIFLLGYVLASFDFGKSASFVVQLVYGTVLVITLAGRSLDLRQAVARLRPATQRAGIP